MAGKLVVTKKGEGSVAGIRPVSGQEGIDAPDCPVEAAERVGLEDLESQAEPLLDADDERHHPLRPDRRDRQQL
jgi:hypothetical protein